MLRIIPLRQFLRAMAILLVFSIVSCSSTEKTCSSSDDLEALSAQAVGEAESLHAAQSALEATQRGDTEAARVILEQQIEKGLIDLRSVRPQLISGKALSTLEQENIDEDIQHAESYVREHKLRMPPSHE
jgi:hypothetical protein